MKRIFALITVMLLMLSLCSCTENRVSKDEAKEAAESLIDYVSKGDFEGAKSLLHPSRGLNIEHIFNFAESEYGVDFQSGITIERYTGFSVSLYDSEIDGGDYELDIRISVDGIPLELTVEVVRNPHGYGIYEIDIDD